MYIYGCKLNKWEVLYNIYILINIVCIDGREVVLWEMNGLGGGVFLFYLFFVEI